MCEREICGVGVSALMYTVEVRGQLCGINSHFLPLWLLGIELRLSDLCIKCPWPAQALLLERIYFVSKKCVLEFQN